MAEYRVLISRQLEGAEIPMLALAAAVFPTKEEAKGNINLLVQSLKRKDEGMYPDSSYRGEAMPQHVAHKRLRTWIDNLRN